MKIDEIAKFNLFIVDINFLLDWGLPWRPGHKYALSVSSFLKNKNVAIPAHAFFEGASAIRCEMRSRGRMIEDNELFIGEDGPTLDIIPINKDFIQKHIQPPFVDLKGGDMIYGAIVVHNTDAILITADKKMHSVVKKITNRVILTDTLAKLIG